MPVTRLSGQRLAAAVRKAGGPVPALASCPPCCAGHLRVPRLGLPAPPPRRGRVLPRVRRRSCWAASGQHEPSRHDAVAARPPRTPRPSAHRRPDVPSVAVLCGVHPCVRSRPRTVCAEVTHHSPLTGASRYSVTRDNAVRRPRGPCSVPAAPVPAARSLRVQVQPRPPEVLAGAAPPPFPTACLAQPCGAAGESRVLSLRTAEIPANLLSCCWHLVRSELRASRTRVCEAVAGRHRPLNAEPQPGPSRVGGRARG